MEDEPLIGLHVKLPVSLYERLEDYWHAHRLHSRSVAVRQLIAQGLAAAADQPRKETLRP
jgi:hypothetical protein